MKLSIQSANIINTDLSNLDEALSLVKDSGFSAIDFNFTEYDHDVIKQAQRCPFFEKSTDILINHYKPLIKACEKYGVEVGQSHAPYPTFVFGADKKFNDYMYSVVKKTIKISAALGSKYIVIHPIFSADLTKKLDIKSENEINIEFYSSLSNIAKECNITICLENMYSKYKGKIYGDICSDAYEATLLIDKLNEKAGREIFGFCFDSGHCTLAGRDPYRTLRVLGDRVKVLHLHDNDGIVDKHLPPFTGVAYWDLILKGLHDIGYKGNINFETYKTLDNVSKTDKESIIKLLGQTGKHIMEKVQ
ncbi:MAG: sugar phosphate isomerase/epimerase [Clostridia bacterium]|nr:sugar phosphate isomerase/epimerase [Clostridia bacterium]